MKDATKIIGFIKMKKKFSKYGLFIGIFNDQFVIGRKKYARNYAKMIEKHDNACTESPFVFTDTLEEAILCCHGFCLGIKKRIIP